MPGLIAVAGAIVTSPQIAVPVPILSSPSTKSFIDEKGIYSGVLTIQVAGLPMTSPSGAVTTAPATADIPPLGQFIKDDEKQVMELNDTLTIPVTWQQGTNTETIPVTFTITNAGQIKAEEM